MQLNKLISLREAQRRLISTQQVKFEEELSYSKFKKLLEILTEKADFIKVLNDKIVNHADIEDIVSESYESEEYSINLELNIQELRDKLEQIAGVMPIQPQNEKQNGFINGCTATATYSTRQDSSEDTSRVSSQSNNIANSSVSYHKLPKLTLPHFYGDITEWQTFWDCFESSVHLNKTLSDVQKFSYLRSLLHGDAASCIAGFPLTHMNYIKALDLLKQRVGQPHKIISTYMQSLLELPRPENNRSSLHHFHDKLETYIRGLESLGQCEHSYGDLLVPIIRDKLPGQLRRSMARGHGNSQWKLPELRLAIEREINILQEGETSELPDAHVPTASFFVGSRNSDQRQTHTVKSNASTIQRKPCPFCGGEHNASECNKVKSVEARIECVKRKKLCYNCLAGGHQRASCKSRFRCRHCRRRHHTSICEQQKPSATLNPRAAPFQSSTDTRSDTAILHSTTQPRQRVLLKTAIAKVSSTQCTKDANILFDEGAQKSFITEKLADDLHIQQKGTETIHLASFRDMSRNVQQMATTTIYLHTDICEKLAIDVLIVPTIAGPLSNMQREVKSLNYLRELKLAHPVSDEDSFEVSLLIGADVYWKIVQDRVVRGNGPTAVQSKIGYLLSGPLPPSEEHSPVQHMMHVVTSQPNNFDQEHLLGLESYGVHSEVDDASSSGDFRTCLDTCVSCREGGHGAETPLRDEHPPLPSYDTSTRPLTNVIFGVAEAEQLTPFHLLLGRRLNQAAVC